MFRYVAPVGLIVAFALPSVSYAWGKRGHAIVCETAANLASRTDAKAEFLAGHSFDLGYYCNVPDLVWKKPATYQLEKNNHFMDLEIFDRALGEKTKDAFALDRKTFEKSHPDVKEEAGRAFWRVRELDAKLEAYRAALGKGISDKDKRHDTQLQWLVVAGAIGHYVGDLAQPLHVTENYDGQMSNQKGIHSFYEETLVDELSRSPSPNALAADVGARAAKDWAEYRKKAKRLSTLEILHDLSRDSIAEMPKLLAADKANGRKDLQKAAGAHRDQIVARMAMGAMALAELWSRRTGMEFDEAKFYSFAGAPEFVPVEGATPKPSSAKD